MVSLAAVQIVQLDQVNGIVLVEVGTESEYTLNFIMRNSCVIV